MGGRTPEHWDRLADILAENLRLIDDGKKSGLRKQVNDPAFAKQEHDLDMRTED